MLSCSAVLLANVLFFMLRASPAAGSFPLPLSAREEREALAAMAAGDESARNRLIEHNLRLVAHVVKKYYAAREDQDDLISIGTIGLIKAVGTFDAGKNARLATYACRCIENEILMYFRAQRKQSQEVSLSEPIDSDSDGNAISLMDVIRCDDQMLEEIDLSDRRGLLHRYLAEELDGREREILALRYGLGGREPRTQRETAEKLGISRSYVSRIEKKALAKLAGRFGEG
ncbi:MAG: RNA polymerase sporulation sigma factor SigK [Clostridia bacterium]|nr:RNA polymerase sporulation sigma factor SigK [Clostridia bacterium]MDY2929892.1 RNA polymerase sporulation sigma factor SigK [Clostridiaceae bacterium]